MCLREERGDTIFGTDGDNEFAGKGGDDSLFGKRGSDTYIYGSGDGNDFIDDEDGSTDAVDTLVFTDINADDILLGHSGVDLTVTINPTGEIITIDEQFYDHRHFGIDQFEFADGTIWDRAQIEAHYYDDLSTIVS